MTTRDIAARIGNPYTSHRFQRTSRVDAITRRRFAALLIASPVARLAAVIRLRNCGCDVGPQTSLGAIIDLANNICEWNGMEIACNLIREYDDQTGATHFEYAMPEETGNVNIWRVNANNTLTYQNPTQTDLYPVTQAPVLNYNATPTPYDNPVFPGQAATHYTTAPTVAPSSPQPAPTRPAPPPAGTFDYGNPNDPYRSNPRRQPGLPGRGGSQTVTTTTTQGGQGNQGQGQGSGDNSPAPPVNDPIGAGKPPSPMTPSVQPESFFDKLQEAPAWALLAGIFAVGAVIATKGK